MEGSNFRNSVAFDLLFIVRERMPPSVAVRQSLFLHFADALCPECGAKPDNPALCLLTGRFVCNVWRGCSDVSRAPGLGAGRGGGGVSGGLLHARERCGGSCLLLSLRSTRVVAMRGNRWATCQSPYLDAHGKRKNGVGWRTGWGLIDGEQTLHI